MGIANEGPLTIDEDALLALSTAAPDPPLAHPLERYELPGVTVWATEAELLGHLTSASDPLALLR